MSYHNYYITPPSLAPLPTPAANQYQAVWGLGGAGSGRALCRPSPAQISACQTAYPGIA